MVRRAHAVKVTCFCMHCLIHTGRPMGQCTGRPIGHGDHVSTKCQMHMMSCRGPYIRMLDNLAKTHLAGLKTFSKDEDKELILRFFAFFNNLQNFKPPMYRFLNAEIQQRQHLNQEAVHSFESRFKNTFELVRPKRWYQANSPHAVTLTGHHVDASNAHPGVPSHAIALQMCHSHASCL